MNPAGRMSRMRTGILLLLLAFLSVSCGSGSSDLAGGGTGGTGISTGAVSGFGSVVVNGVHFRTDNNVAPGYRTRKMVNGWEDKFGRSDEEVFDVGMVVTVRHGESDNNAFEIEYWNNLLGPVAATESGTDNIIVVLGHSVVVDDAAVFSTILAGDIVEVSGFVDATGRIRAKYISRVSHSVKKYEIKGFVSGLSGDTFRLGTLTDNQSVTVVVSYGPAAISGLPGGLEEGMYVLVSTGDKVPAGDVINATGIVKLSARTEFPDGAAVDLEGLVTAPPRGSGKVLSFAVEGKQIRTDDATDFTGHSPAEIQPDTMLLVQGKENRGVLSAARIVFQ